VFITPYVWTRSKTSRRMPGAEGSLHSAGMWTRGWSRSTLATETLKMKKPTTLAVRGWRE